MSEVRKKFATQVDPVILAAVRQLAQTEGRQLPALVEEALSDLLEKRKRGRPRSNALAAYQASHEAYAPLYEKLAG